MAKGDEVEMQGTVTDCPGGGWFAVNVPTASGEHRVLAQLCGKMKQHKIRVVPGDKVTVVVSPYDLTRGRIMTRERGHT